MDLERIESSLDELFNEKLLDSGQDAYVFLDYGWRRDYEGDYSCAYNYEKDSVCASDFDSESVRNEYLKLTASVDAVGYYRDHVESEDSPSTFETYNDEAYVLRRKICIYVMNDLETLDIGVREYIYDNESGHLIDPDNNLVFGTEVELQFDDEEFTKTTEMKIRKAFEDAISNTSYE